MHTKFLHRNFRYGGKTKKKSKGMIVVKKDSEFDKITVLLVEDDKAIQELFQMELGKHGFGFICCPNSREALKYIYSEKVEFDFCILDEDLPDGTGLNLLHQFKPLHPDIPVIFMTGHGSHDMFKAAIQGGAFDYIEKPFSIEKDILPVIKRLLYNLSLKKENIYLNDQIIHNSKLATLGELSATVVHDIRGPLAMIQVTCEDLAEEFADKKSLDEATLKQHIGQIGKACTRIKKLVDHLRNYARNDINEVEETKLLSSIIEDSFFMVEQKIRKFGIKTITDIEDPLINAELICFPNKLEQVLMNLMSNACDAMQNVSEKVLTVKAKSEHGFLYLSVTDSGVGIPENVMPKIFESFFTTKPKNEGTGLGLSIVRNIVKEHEGDLSVESKVGIGTTFTIKLSTSKIILPQNSENIPSAA